MPSFLYEDKYSALTAGIDEAGRGPWVGPVVAGAVIFLKRNVEPYLLEHLNDSKKLSSHKREELFNLIIQETQKGKMCYGIGQASSAEIDELNILQATFLAMRRAVLQLPVPPNFAIIDGNRLPKEFICPAACLIKGDSLSYSVAAASVMAKVTRDRQMVELSKIYSGYGFEKNAGYGTKEHINGLQKYGITPEHRKSYKPIKEIITKKIA